MYLYTNILKDHLVLHFQSLHCVPTEKYSAIFIEAFTSRKKGGQCFGGVKTVL